MATLQQVEDHRDALNDLTTLAIADFVAQWRTFDLEDAAAVERQARAALADLSDAYGYAAAGQAADWYDDLRTESLATGTYRATLTTGISAPQVEALAGWGTGPLYGVADPDAALTRMAGGLQRMVTGADRDTILTNTRRDPADVRWYRAASANACAFCAMNASRGAVYRSSATADFKSHNYCRCLAVALFPGETAELPPYYQDFADAYSTAADEVAAGGSARRAKPILSRMRKLRGTR